MAIEHVLPVVPVSDIDAARGWYERLFGRAPDNQPMESLVEWRITGTGWLQVSRDAGRPGSAYVNFAVDDLNSHLAELASRGIETGEVEGVSKGVQLAAVTDPDGNTITFIGNFRISY